MLCIDLRQKMKIFEVKPFDKESADVQLFCTPWPQQGKIQSSVCENPDKDIPCTHFSLAMRGCTDNKTYGQSQKETPSERMVFLFGIWQRAGLNSLPRPARSASNPEVRQGSHEWLCHSRDAGSESSLVARSKRKRPPTAVFWFSAPSFDYGLWHGSFCCACISKVKSL